MAKKRIFITGASGFIGRNLVESFSGKYEIFAPSHKELDLLDAAAVQRYIKKNDFHTIIHSANKGGGRDTIGLMGVVEQNLRMFFNLARCSALADRMIYFGSGAEYGKHRDLKKIKESQFDEVVPKDDYGFYKYICSKHAEKSDNILNLRLFGVFGKYENYEYKFISNAILKNLFSRDIIISQNVVFDYLYITDLVKIVDHFLSHRAKHKAYNVTPDRSIDLLNIAKAINEISPKKSKARVLNPGFNYEYTGSNARLKAELTRFQFTEYRTAMRELLDYYLMTISDIRLGVIAADPYLSKCKIRSCDSHEG